MTYVRAACLPWDRLTDVRSSWSFVWNSLPCRKPSTTVVISKAQCCCFSFETKWASNSQIHLPASWVLGATTPSTIFFFPRQDTSRVSGWPQLTYKDDLELLTPDPTASISPGGIIGKHHCALYIWRWGQSHGFVYVRQVLDQLGYVPSWALSIWINNIILYLLEWKMLSIILSMPFIVRCIPSYMRYKKIHMYFLGSWGCA